jgi:hypothetical protein
MMGPMPRPIWFLLVAIVLRLSLGSAWAIPAEATLANHQPGKSSLAGSGHCHEAATSLATSAETESNADSAIDTQLSCCSANHCQLCSATGISHASQVPIPSAAVRAANVHAAAWVGWTYPPELRPPI